MFGVKREKMGKDKGNISSKTEETIRIDKWLKIARFYKQREKAADGVERGHVKVNGNRVKAAKLVKVGDTLTIKRDSVYKTCVIKKILFRSISAILAQEMYEFEESDRDKILSDGSEKSEFIKILEDQDNENRLEAKKAGKPNKKERRILSKYRNM